MQVDNKGNLTSFSQDDQSDHDIKKLQAKSIEIFKSKRQTINAKNNFKLLGKNLKVEKKVNENDDSDSDYVSKKLSEDTDDSPIFRKSFTKRRQNQNEENDIVIDQSQKSNLDNIYNLIEQSKKQLDFQFNEGQLDFPKKLFLQWEEKNTIKTPYTYTLMEDAMYVDEGIIITLQYHIFNTEGDHILLTPIGLDESPKDNLSKSSNENPTNFSKLNTQKYQKEGMHPMSIFKNPPQNLFDDGISFEEASQIGEFMKAEEKDIKKEFKLEGILCFWKSYPSGKMEKMFEKSFTTGMPFAYTRLGNMTLQLTNDKKVLHLTYISNYSDKDNQNMGDGQNMIKSDIKVQILAWEIDVKKCQFGKDLKNQFTEVNLGLQKYLVDNASQIHLIRSIKLTASLNYLVLTFNQQKNRIDFYQKEKENGKKQFILPKQNTKKIARKYTLFDVKTGEMVLEYGGCYQDFEIQESNKIFSLGIVIKDCQINKPIDQNGKRVQTQSSIDEEVAFFCVGKIVDWSEAIQNNFSKAQMLQSQKLNATLRKKQQNAEEYDWTLALKKIKLKEIIAGGDNSSKRQKWIKDKLKQHCLELKVNEKLKTKDCFQFKSSCITSREDWETSLIVQVNSFFDQIGILNIPQVTNSQNPRCFFLYHRKSAQIIQSRQKNQQQQSFISDLPSMPFVVKRLPKEGLIQHGRNSQLKKDMYYVVQPPRYEGYGSCIKINRFGYEQKPELQIKVSTKHVPYNQFDVWCYKEQYKKGQPAINGFIDDEDYLQELEDDYRRVMQICSIDTISLQLELMTKIPRKSSFNRYDYIVKSSDTFQQQQAQWPLFAYNLGVEKIAIIHLAKQERIKQYIYAIQKGHKFLCFADFNSYQDIGFFAEGLLIEGCARICFLTQNKDYICLNLLLIDPYHKPMQFCVFTSSFVIKQEDFRVEDMLECCFIIPSKRSQEVVGKDKEFSIYAIIQYKKIIRRSRFKHQDDEQLVDEDSDFGMNFSDVYCDNLQLNIIRPQQAFLEQVYMQMDEKNFIYYVSRIGVLCKIMEINPKKSNLRYHTCIYEIKADKCCGFSVSRNGRQFMFIDENKTFFQLERVVDSRKLKMISENRMNETFESDFSFKDYDPCIISPQYVISSNKIFYLWKDDPFPNGIFQMENLSESEKMKMPISVQSEVKWFQGPILFQGSNQFAGVDRVRKFYAYLKVQSLPDSTTKTLMVDNMNQIDMSTFLKNGDILIRCGYRFILFDQDGFFKQQVQFSDLDDIKGEDQNELQSEFNTQKSTKKNVNQKVIKDIDFIKQGLIEQGLQDDGNSCDEFDSKQNIGQHNKMELLQFSSDNNKFLFLNRLSFRMKVYELKTIQVKQGDQEIETVYFSKMYTLDSKNSELLKDTRKFMHGENKFKFRDYLEKCLTINIENDGTVSMMLISQPDRTDDVNMHSVFFEVVISIFKVELVNKRYKILTHNVKEQFPKPQSNEIQKCHSYEKEYYISKINENQMIQERFPSHLKDATNIDIIQENLQYLEDRQRRLIHGINSNGLLILWQGSWIRWTRIDFNEGAQAKLKKDLNLLKVTFHDQYEILRVFHSVREKVVHSGYVEVYEDQRIDVIQILMKIHSIDQYDNKYIILTWDITNDVQLSIFEVDDEQNEMLEFNLMKGMHEKLNYFLDKYSIIDLDTGVHTMVARHLKDVADHQSYLSTLRLCLRFENQRKIFMDTSRYLLIMRPRVLVFSYSYMQMVLWRDIKDKKDKLSLFRQVVSLTDFMVDFDGQYLFHVYIKKSDVIQYIHDLYMSKKRAGKLTGQETILPLFIMTTDFHNYTALFRCIQYENYKSFELLVSMLTNACNAFVTKNIIRSLPVMLTNESDAVLRYFDHNFYSPKAFEEPQMLSWPQELDNTYEIIFPTNTTLLSLDELKRLLTGQTQAQIQETTDLTVEQKTTNDVLEDEETKLWNQLSQMNSKLELYEKIAKGNTELSSYSRQILLPEQVEDNSLTADLKGGRDEIGDSSKNKRVLVRVIDFDFLFENSNSTNLIGILSSQANRRVLTRESIKAFVQLMWQTYQPTIFWRVFTLYVVYLFSFMSLCGQGLPAYWNQVKIKNIAIQNNTYDDSMQPKPLLCLVNIVISTFILFYLGSFEAVQFFSGSPIDYFSSPWNVIDVSQLGINGFILAYAFIFIEFEYHLASTQNIVTIAAFGSCLMWVKMFYWMRLFEATAKYVSLIIATIADITFFMVMVIIIIITFASFFLIINENAKSVGQNYIPEYGFSPLISAFISTYFITIGEFSYDSYSHGPNVVSCWIMFLFATFFNCVVFMNMLVAIMSQTFSEVTAAQEESGLHEQISLIADYVTLVDHKKVWKTTRYIIRVQVIEQTEESDTNIRDLLSNLEENLDKKTERLYQQQQRKLSTIEDMLDSLTEQQSEIKSFMTQIIGMQKASMDTESSEEEGEESSLLKVEITKEQDRK